MENAIAESNRNETQGATYQVMSEPYVTLNVVAVDPTSTGQKIFEKMTVKQWRSTCHFSRTYEYVGLTKAAAESGAETVRDAYTVPVAKWGIGIVTDVQTGTAEMQMVEIGNAPQCFAEATPTHTAGQMWSLQVRVNATVESYTVKDGTPPSAADVEALVSSIADFPEDT